MEAHETVVYIYESEIQAIVGEAQRFPTTETGGDLFGTFTHGNMPVIWLASGPGPKAKHLATHFEQDVYFTSQWQRRLMNDFGVQYIGSWHSHHTLNINHPSGGDMQAARNYAINHGRKRTLEIITNHEGRKPVTSLRPYFYPNAQEGGCTPAVFTELRGESPLRVRLGGDESAFSCGLDWRHVFRNLYKLTAYQDPQPLIGLPSSDAELNLPSGLESAIRHLEYDGIEVEQRGETFMVVIPVTEERSLAIAVQNSQEPNIIQINMIDYASNRSTDITTCVQEAGIPLSISKRNVRIFKNIISFVQGSDERTN